MISVVLFLHFIFCKCENFCGVDYPVISVVVPVYNRQSIISVCLRSLLNQTLRNIEVVCVDDGSIDDTLQTLSSFAGEDKRVVVIQQEHCGVSCARNTGLSVAKGEYITFVDSDDWVELNAYESVYEKAKEKNVEIVQFGVFDERSKGKEYEPYKEGVFRGIDCKRFMMPKKKRFSATTCNKIYSRHLLNRANSTFDVTVKFGEDLMFNLDVIPFVNSIFVIEKRFYHYTYDAPGGSSRYRLFDDKVVFIEGIIRHIDKIDATKWPTEGDMEEMKYFIQNQNSILFGKGKQKKKTIEKKTTKNKKK